MHILLIHQAFVSIDEPGGTRHHEMANYLAERGHRVTVIASPVVAEAHITPVAGVVACRTLPVIVSRGCRMAGCTIRQVVMAEVCLFPYNRTVAAGTLTRIVIRWTLVAHFAVHEFAVIDGIFPAIGRMAQRAGAFFVAHAFTLAFLAAAAAQQWLLLDADQCKAVLPRLALAAPIYWSSLACLTLWSLIQRDVPWKTMALHLWPPAVAIARYWRPPTA